MSKNKSIRQRILAALKNKGRKMSMQELYQELPDVAETTVRGKVYNALGKGITRVGRGLYISSEAIVEFGNSLKIIDRMIEEGDMFDFVFLDIPYKAGGNQGGPGKLKDGSRGNRNLFKPDKISVEEFGEFIEKVDQLLVSDTAPIIYMFTSGKSSKSHHDRYFNKIGSVFNLCAQGSYEKLWKNGNPMNMGKYKMPEEHIYVFTRSGEIDVDNPVLDFSLAPDVHEYPTSKPYPMIKSLVAQFTQVGDWCFDPFGGSGKILEACLELGRMCHIIDNSEKSYKEHLVPILVKNEI